MQRSHEIVFRNNDHKSFQQVLENIYSEYGWVGQKWFINYIFYYYQVLIWTKTSILPFNLSKQ